MGMSLVWRTGGITRKISWNVIQMVIDECGAEERGFGG
jgi:hypothetical protein